jgi:hypothetical protein
MVSRAAIAAAERNSFLNNASDWYQWTLTCERLRLVNLCASWESIMMRTLRRMTYLMLVVGLSLAVADSAHAIKILMHGREPGPTFRDDPFTFMHLETVFGADNVDYMQGSVAPADGSAANGFDVLYISSSMASSDTRDKYDDSPVGIVNSENALIHDNNVGNFFLSDAGGNRDNYTVIDLQKINIVDPSHPLAAGLSGEVTVFNSTSGNWWQFAQGALGPGVVRVAETLLADVGTDPQHAILAADKGAQLLGDGTAGKPATAAGRRVFFFLSDIGSFDLTADGFKLFDAAIQWAAEEPASADFDADGDVDGADFTVWQRGLGTTGTAQPINGDANGDTNVDGADLAVWQAQFIGTSASSAVSAVPEPVSAALIISAAVGALVLGRAMSKGLGAR